VKRAAAASVVYVAVLLLAPPAIAQWPRQQTPGVPRDADGEPDLAGLGNGAAIR